LDDPHAAILLKTGRKIDFRKDIDGPAQPRANLHQAGRDDRYDILVRGGVAHSISVPNELATGRPNTAEPVRRKPNDMLAGSTDLGEGLTTSGKPGPDNIMAVTSDPFRGPNADRWCRYIWANKNPSPRSHGARSRRG
jgi:hypothetical protein